MPARPADWKQRVGGLTVVPRLLADLGADPARVLAGVGLAADALDDPENYIPYAAAAALLDRCARSTGCAHFGLLAGEAWRVDHMGLAGALACHSATLGEAMRTLTVYMRLNNQGAASYLQVDTRMAEWGYAIFHPGVTELAAVYDTAMASAVNVVRDLLGDADWRPVALLLPRATPADTGPYTETLGAPVSFDADRAALRFRAADLERPLPAADAVRRAALLREADERLGDQFLPGVYATLRTLLIEGGARSDFVAANLDMHKRTLARRLAKHGTTFQKVLDEVRYETARQMLRETDRPIAQIAATLGYAEASAFTRSFRRWSGAAPQAWRKRAAP